MLTAWRPLDNARAAHDDKRMFDQAIAEQITERLSAGEPLEAICRNLPGAPTSRTIRSWVAENPTFASEVAHAREVGYDAIAAECLPIIDDCPADSDHVQLARARVDTRLKLLRCWDPKRYGDRIAVDADLRLQVTIDDPTLRATATLLPNAELPKP